MITKTVVEEICRLLQSGRFSQRAIARRMQISRGTVGAVAKRTHAFFQRKTDGPHNGFVFPAGMPVRCPRCGAKVQMPCLACYLRDYLQKSKRDKTTED